MAITDKKLINNWHALSLPKKTRDALVFLAGESWLKNTSWYLAGGTAMALQVGHRRSVDLDFFTTKTSFSEGNLVNHFPKEIWHQTLLKEGTIYGELQGAKVSFIAYPFFVPQKPYHTIGSVNMLDLDDIAVMKVIAISQRGRKRDFVDLYWYVKNRLPLIEVIKKLKKQYPSVAHDYHHILKALTFFEDAEEDPQPRLEKPIAWSAVKKFFLSETGTIIRELLKLN